MWRTRKTIECGKSFYVWVVFSVLALLLIPSCRTREEASSPSSDGQPEEGLLNVLSRQEKEEGWKLLFDGRTLAGWRGIGRDDAPPGHWTVEDGAIKKVPGGEVPRQADGQPVQGGDLISVEAFEDFEIRLEWRVSPGGNSGLKYNVSEEMSMEVPPAQAAIGFEYQILDDDGNPDAQVGPNRTASGLYDLLAPENKALNPVGGYNKARIVLRGGHGEHWLNGRKVLEVDLGSPQLEAFGAASKDRDLPGFAAKRRGHIVLQDHGDAVWFRNIKQKEYRPGG